MKKVNEVSKLTGVSKRTLQYYDDEGISIVERSKENHRIYDQSALERLWKILVYREMDFGIKEIKQLLFLTDGEQKIYLEHRIEGIMKQIQGLNEQMEFITYIKNYGIPPLPSEDDERNMTYIEYIEKLKEEYKICRKK